MIFKCRNCGGNTIYSPEKRGMLCLYCDSVDSAERTDQQSGAIQICPNCAGEIPVMEHTSATQCPYCDNYLILNERVEGQYAPKMMIPFRMGKESCKDLIRNHFKKCLFAPTDFLSEARLNEMQGTYVPFWFYDYNVNCDYEGEGTKIRSWTSGNTHYTETSYYNIVRNMDVQFSGIPVDASIQMPDDVMDLMEPYSYQELEAFRPEYMSGFYAEKYNMTSDVVENRARQKRDEDVNQLLKESCMGYAQMRARRNQIRENTRVSSFGLLPVWRYMYKYKDQVYPFYVNGQTGKIVGTAPISKSKVWAYAGTIWACLTLIMVFINGILS